MRFLRFESLIIVWAVAALLSTTGCKEDPPPDDVPEPWGEPQLWPGDDVRPELDHPFFDDHPALADLSTYATFVEGWAEDRPDHQHRGAFAVGNGKVFSLLGTADPVNTLHSLVGPVYERDGFFFGDTAITVEQDGYPAAFDREWVARVRGTAVVITRADTDGVSLYTIDFGPHPGGVADLDVPPALVRVLLVTAIDGHSHDVELVLDSYRTLAETDGLVHEQLESDGRYLGYLPWVGTLEGDGDTYRFPLGEVRPGEGNMAVLVLAAGYSLEEVAAVGDQADAATVEDWLDDTVDWWQTYSSQGVQITSDDPRIDDLHDGMRAGIRVQQSAAGAVCPMSQYTLMWLRDTIGPIKFFLRSGLHEEALSTLDYLFLCAAVRGDFSNACESGLTPDDLVQEPDWDNLGQFNGRLAAEGPSYVPLMYRDYVNFTGDMTPVEERWPYLRRALMAQQMEPDGLQTFSGDETYRVAMSAALGHDLVLMYEEDTWSANSSFLMLAAASWMAQTATELGYDEDAADFAELAALAESALETHYLQPEGHYAPFIFRDGMVPETRPFEDVNLKPLWTGVQDPQDPIALTNLQVLQEHAGRGDGTVQTPLDPAYQDALGYHVEEGIHTGMVPGYYLTTVTQLGDSQAQPAFNALHTYADTAGQYGEYMVYDDHSAFQPIYDPAGGIGDYTARHRPWEGGINIDAMLRYLAGPIVPDQGQDADMVLRPHIPNDLRSMELAHLRSGDAVGTLELVQTDQTISVHFTSETEEPFVLLVEVPIPVGATNDVEDGLDEDGDGWSTLPGGERLAHFAPVEIGALGSQWFFVEVVR